MSRHIPALPAFPGPPAQSERVLHGGSWNNRAKYARAACRDEAAETFADSRVGFRVAFDAGG